MQTAKKGSSWNYIAVGHDTPPDGGGDGVSEVAKL